MMRWRWPLIASLLLVSGAARAATYQVGPTRTWTQLGQAMATVGPGDIVEVDGNASYSAVNWTTSGSAAQPIRLVGVRVNGARPRLQGGANTIEVAADNVVVEGFDITGGSDRCFFHHGHNIVLRDSVVHDCPKQGVLGADQDSGSLLMEYVEVHHCGGGSRDHQVYMATDEVAHPGSVFRMQYCYIHDANGGDSVKSRAERNEIYFNWIEGGQNHELELAGPDPYGASSAWTLDLKREDSDIVGNVLRKRSNFYVARIGGDDTGWSKGRYRFVNNTIITMSGGSAVFRLFDELESVEMHNNVIASDGGGAPDVMRAAASEFAWVNGVNIAGSNNWVQTGTRNIPAQWTGTVMGTSPGVMNLDNDVRPVAGSPLVNAGQANPTGPSGFPFPNPLWPPNFNPPMRALLPVGSASPRIINGAPDIGAFELGQGTGQGGSAGGGALGSAGAGGSATSSGSAGRGGGTKGGCSCTHAGLPNSVPPLIGLALVILAWFRLRSWRGERRQK